MHRVIFSTFFYRSGWHFKMFSREVANKNTQISRRLGKEQRCHDRKRQERTASNIVFTSMLISRNYLPPLFRIWSIIKRNLLHWSRKLKMIYKCFPNLKLHNQNEETLFTENESVYLYPAAPLWTEFLSFDPLALLKHAAVSWAGGEIQ